MSQNKKRIEPSFSISSVNLSQQGESHSHIRKNTQAGEELSFTSRLINTYIPKAVQLAKTVLNIINKNRKLSAYICSVISLLIIIIILFSSDDNETLEQHSNLLEQTDKNDNLNIVTGLNNTQYKVAFHDNFSLMTNAYKGVVINWQGEHSEKNTLWDIRRTTGNKACEYMQLNSKDRYRTISVINDDVKGYLAYFSPLDSESIIKSLARKNSFTLCGYEFSLKGSQTLLGKHTYYSNFLSE